MNASRSTKKTLRAFAILAGLVLTYLLYLYATNNFHTVVEGELYRSAQLHGAEWDQLQKKYAFKTVLNLRGVSPEETWYQQEKAESERLGLNHIDFPMSAVHPLAEDKALKLIEILRTAPKPILVHCRSGADRTGLASAFYLAAVANRGEAESERQLSIRFGHFSLPFLSEFNMDLAFDKYETHLGLSDS